MVYQQVTQILIVGTRVVRRAFGEAWKQAAATSKYQAEHGKNATGGATQGSTAKTQMTLDEATRILDVKASKQTPIDLEQVTSRFKRLFDANEPKQGGSFYLQSKILRARERLEAEAGEVAQRKEAADQAQKGWRPKVYK